jgi:hypothetical protein
LGAETFFGLATTGFLATAIFLAFETATFLAVTGLTVVTVW